MGSDSEAEKSQQKEKERKREGIKLEALLLDSLDREWKWDKPIQIQERYFHHYHHYEHTEHTEHTKYMSFVIIDYRLGV